MGPYIEKVKTVIKDTQAQLSSIYSDIKFRASIVGYRYQFYHSVINKF